MRVTDLSIRFVNWVWATQPKKAGKMLTPSHPISPNPSVKISLNASGCSQVATWTKKTNACTNNSKPACYLTSCSSEFHLKSLKELISNTAKLWAFFSWNSCTRLEIITRPSTLTLFRVNLRDGFQLLTININVRFRLEKSI